jgi:hypothetical protein
MGANGRVPVEPSATFTARGTPDPPPPPASQANAHSHSTILSILLAEDEK